MKTAFVHYRPVVARVASMLRLEQFPRLAGEAILNLLKTLAIIFPDGSHVCSPEKKGCLKFPQPF